jgi:hypothetical protein
LDFQKPWLLLYQHSTHIENQMLWNIRSALFWDITQSRVVILYRRFRTTYPSHLQV